MPEPKITSDLFLGRELPAQIGSYVVERLLSAGPSYADYDARHRTLGHAVLFRHERWPSQAIAHGSRSDHPIDNRATQLDALEGLKRSRRLQAELQHPRILPVV